MKLPVVLAFTFGGGWGDCRLRMPRLEAGEFANQNQQGPRGCGSFFTPGGRTWSQVVVGVEPRASGAASATLRRKLWTGRMSRQAM